MVGNLFSISKLFSLLCQLPGNTVITAFSGGLQEEAGDSGGPTSQTWAAEGTACARDSVPLPPPPSLSCYPALGKC